MTTAVKESQNLFYLYVAIGSWSDSSRVELARGGAEEWMCERTFLIFHRFLYYLDVFIIL
jgi:hypothetical protein